MTYVTTVLLVIISLTTPWYQSQVLEHILTLRVYQMEVTLV